MEDKSFNDGFRAPKRRKKKGKEGHNGPSKFPQKMTPSEVLVHQLESSLAELRVSYDQYTFTSVMGWKKKIEDSLFWKSTKELDCFSGSKASSSSHSAPSGLQFASVGRIVCLGLGSMATTDFSMRRARPQFSFLLLLRELLQSCGDTILSSAGRPYVSLCEPMLTAEDVALINHFQISVLENTCGRYSVSEPLPITIKASSEMLDRKNGDDPGITVFWMPHCPKELYASVLRANWSPTGLSKVVIIGNSFNNITASPPSETDRVTLGRVFAVSSIMSSFPLPEYSDDPYIFNNTCIHIFKPSAEHHPPSDTFWTVPPEEDLALSKCFSPPLEKPQLDLIQ